LLAAELDSVDDDSLPLELALVEVSEPVVGLLEVVVDSVALEELDALVPADDAARFAAAVFAAARAVAAFFAAAALAAARRWAAVCVTEAPAALVLAAVAVCLAERAGSCPEASCT
jgi:hypothetical protein